MDRSLFWITSEELRNLPNGADDGADESPKAAAPPTSPLPLRLTQKNSREERRDEGGMRGRDTQASKSQ